MARNFVPNADRLDNASAPVTAVPFTVHLKLNTDTTAAGQDCAFSLNDGTTDNRWEVWRNGSAVSQWAGAGGAGSYDPASIGTLTAGVYSAVTAVYATNASRTLYVDGSSGSGTVSRATTGINQVRIGNRATAGNFSWSGDIAEVAIWDVALTAADHAQLQTFASALLVRSASLVSYWRLGGWYSPEIDLVGGFDLTVTTATKSVHPRVIYPFGGFKLGIAKVRAAVTGTATASITEADVVAGGKTIIITLKGDTWVTAGATFDAQRQNIINGIDSAQSEATGWDAEVKAKEVVGAVVRTSDTVVTVTLTAAAAYNITAQETITVTVPATALTGGVAVVATPTFTVAAAAGAGWGPLLGLQNNRLVLAA